MSPTAPSIGTGELTMVSQQRATGQERFDVVPPVIASAATQYQYARAIEKEHLALMAQHDLLGEWSNETRTTVLTARTRIQEAREARDLFRGQVRTFVLALRSAGEPLPAVLRHTRSMIHLLERANAITPDGWLEAEVVEWAIHEFEDRS
jgi:hypothetical protein